MVEGARLESERALACLEGSNPSLSFCLSLMAYCAPGAKRESFLGISAGAGCGESV